MMVVAGIGCSLDSDEDLSLAVAEETLDPRTSDEWNELRAQSHRILDRTLDSLAALRGEPAWRPMPPHVRKAVAGAKPSEEEHSLPNVYAEFLENIEPYGSGNRHPRAWGWVRGQGTPIAMLADMLASAMNAHVGGSATAPALLEETVLGWLAEALGLIEWLETGAEGSNIEGLNAERRSSGILTSGATMANLLGLAVARHAKADWDVRENGLSDRARMTIYCSSEVHGWAEKTVELLGLGRRSMRVISAGADYRMDIGRLRQVIEEDRAAGLFPLAVVATAGSVNTGAFDDLCAIRAVCDEFNLWMHVDGAFGALLRISSRYRPLVAGLERADSIAFDLHKWMSLPFETGCLMVRDRAAHEAAFQTKDAAYMEKGERGIMAAGWPMFMDRGLEGSRGFKALRVWMQLRTLGVRRHRAVIEKNMRQAAWVETRVGCHPELEMLAPRPANVVCFGYRPGGSAWSRLSLNHLNRELVLRIQESGEFVVSGTTLQDGVFAIRLAMTNHRSRISDFEALLNSTVSLGAQIAVDMGMKLTN
jgi:aromatic-L-amino-acid/L-tryptophan decarboxylase